MGETRRNLWVSFRDVVSEGVTGLTGRGSRSWLTTAGITVGVASLVAVVGLTQTSTERLLRQLDTLTPTLVTASPVAFADTDTPTLTWEVERRLDRLDGVVTSGAIATVHTRTIEVTGPPVRDPTQPASQQFEVMVATSRTVEVLGGEVAQGRFFDRLHDTEPYPVVVLGPAAARSLRLAPIDGHTSILVDDQPHVVLGVLADHQATSQLASAVLFPASRALELGTPGPEIIYVRARPGLTETVADQLPEVLHPGAPRDISTFVSLPARQVTDLVETETSNLFVLLSIVAIILATLTVSVVMLMTVLERRTEIGLRRAIGATKPRIAAEFLVHSIWLGILGGTAGTALGTLTTATTATLTNTSPITDFRIILAGPLIGTIAGLLAGVYPAARAARTPPAQALRAI